MEFSDLINKYNMNNRDDKFGWYNNDKQNNRIKKVVLEGVCDEAEVVVNSAGGKQSKAPMAFHLVDPQFLFTYFNESKGYSEVIDWLVTFMQTGKKVYLINAVDLYCLLN